MASSAPSEPGPVAEPQRALALDVLRGFAVLGILLANIQAFVDPGSLYLRRPAHGSDALARDLVTFAVEAKFYVLFAVLFGYGLALQMERAAAHGAALAPRVLRRLALLFTIGAVHATLLFSGDILMIYAIAGVALLALRGVSPRIAVGLGLAVLSLFAALLGLAVVASALVEDMSTVPDRAALAARAQEVTANYRSVFPRIVSQRLADLRLVIVEWWSLIPIVLGYFLLGLAAGKVRLLHDHPPRRLLVRALVAGVAIGVPISALFTYLPSRFEWSEFATGLGYFTAPALTVAYVAALLLTTGTRPGRQLSLPALASVGRLALTNYLGQSLICVFLFTGYGFALAGRVGDSAALAIAVVIYLAQVAVSAWWLRRHPIGPIEWLLRSFTYLRWQPWRRRAAAA